MDAIKNVLADQFWFSVILSLVVFGAIMTAVAYAILLERKISAWIQDRYGPNRVGPLGLLQPLADGAKLFLKEDIIPKNVERTLFLVAPWMIFIVALIGYAVVPWGGAFRWPWMDREAPALLCQVASIDIGLLYIVAVASLGVYGVVLGGWASNNKYSFYGGMRAAAQMLSYEIPMAMMILVGILTTGSLRLEAMVSYQAEHTWTLVYHPLAALVLFVTALAEANRAPFDLAECEQELIGGFHTEYSAMKWAMFFLGEYAHMITASALMVAMFFGGYLVPGWTWLNTSDAWTAMVLRMGVFGVKIALFICLYMVVRWTLPRFRFDQLMRLAWKALVPIGIALVLLQVWIVYQDLPQWYATVGNVLVLIGAAVLGAAWRRPVTGREQSLIRADRLAGREAVGQGV
ncbi:MAG: NADH-quinone oxidoreductase subunit NuoH [Phycisphaerae bacterium]